MPFLREISIEGLFGLYDHSLVFRDEPRVTIVAGPNGIGKTTLLRLATALLHASYRELTRHEFDRLTIVSDEGIEIDVSPIPAEDEDDQLLLRERRAGSVTQESVILLPSQDLSRLALPPFIEPYDSDTFIDTRDSELIPSEVVFTRWGRGVSEPVTIEPPEWFRPDDWQVDFIETKRLDTFMASPRLIRRRSNGAPIDRYLEVVADTLDRARRASARIHQARTSTVARRLLGEYSRKSVNVDKLRARYADVGQHASVLTANGLLSDSLDELPDEKLNPTQKRFFELFLDDFEAKLAPLDPVSAKIDQLRAIVEHKFLNKAVSIDPDQGVVFLAEPYGMQIAPDSLSSGEQHELALISRLLFNETPGTTVLIDEPELSLHVSWQHEMIEDLEEIARVADLAFVLATHSTAIINGRWDLVEELGPLDEGHPRSSDDESQRG